MVVEKKVDIRGRIMREVEDPTAIDVDEPRTARLRMFVRPS